MSLIPKGYQDQNERDKYKEKKCPTIIKCGCPISILIPEGIKAQTTFTLTSLTLDTSCLCDLDIILQFASNTIATEFKGALSEEYLSNVDVKLHQFL